MRSSSWAATTAFIATGWPHDAVAVRRPRMSPVITHTSRTNWTPKLSNLSPSSLQKRKLACVLPHRGRLHLDFRDVHLDKVSDGDEANQLTPRKPREGKKAEGPSLTRPGGSNHSGSVSRSRLASRQRQGERARLDRVSVMSLPGRRITLLPSAPSRCIVGNKPHHFFYMATSTWRPSRQSENDLFTL
jgi:hypothetical protein